MSSGDELIQKLRNDKKYEQVLKAAPNEAKEQIKTVVEEFLKEMGAGLDSLKKTLEDPEVKKQIRSAMLSKKSKE